MLVSGRAQIGTYALRGQCQHIGFEPTQTPCQQGRCEQPAQIHSHQCMVDLLTVLKRNQHIVHQGHGEVRRHQRGRRGGQGQTKAEQQLALVRLGETPQAKQAPRGCGRFFLRLLTAATSFIRLRQRRMTLRAPSLRLIGQLAGLLLLKKVKQRRCFEVVAQREAPIGQLLFALHQAQMAHTCVVRQKHAPIRLPSQRFPSLHLAGRAPEQSGRSENQHTSGEIQSLIKVNLQPS